MSTNMISIAEHKVDGKWIKIEGFEPFDQQSYSWYAFLADVRNYDHCEPISKPKGYPTDSEWLNELQGPDLYSSRQETRMQEMSDGSYYSASWLTLAELLTFDYEKTFWNRRVSKPIYRADGSIGGYDGAALAEKGEGEVLSYRENLGEQFFDEIEKLKTFGAPEDVRIIFWFC